ncbi:hypothetical protein [Aeromicrobium sp. 9AM]|uniref:hypothetical protein n=1 Tax=Aeromicrobium sp. 9AM TaxID=2653126 RepID=UPI0012F04DE5|nr:hypothetical protein [Aeromicrobium sp. 9AM]VXC44335.1 conserved hypothetical protein [Aeromicrobium sp. 9AM]
MTVAPDRPLLPTESVTATLTLDEALDDVTDARIEIGYLNTFKYEWARNSTTDLVGPTSAGGRSDATEWVGAGDSPIVFAGGTLAAGTHTATVRLPSWSPGTSDPAVAWQARLRVERKGRTPEAEASFTVVVPAPDPLPTESRLVQGERAMANSIHFDIVTDSLAYRAGDVVRGTISVTPTEPVSKSATADVRFYRPQVSHPLEKPPSPVIEWFSRPHVTVAKDLMLAQGVTTEIPFELTLPADASPTVEAVHNSIQWWVMATITYAGLTGAIERARREIFVHNA